MKYREEADYNPSCVSTPEGVKRLFEETVALSTRIAELARHAGFTVSDTT